MREVKMDQGWIKLHRKIFENPVVTKDAEHLAVWIYLLTKATHKEYPAIFKGQKIMLQAGQLITGRKSISEKLKINEAKVKRILTNFENDQQIDRQRSNQNSLISILNWSQYQESDQQSDQPVTSQRPASDHKQECKNVKNERNIYKYIVEYLNEKTGKSFKSTTSKTKTCINARLAEGFTEDDFKTVIDKKCAEWTGNKKMEQYLRPETLFGTKFESYLNASVKTGSADEYDPLDGLF